MKLISPRTIVGNRGDLLSRFGILEALQRRCGAEWAVFAHRPDDLGTLVDVPSSRDSSLLPEVLPYGPLYNFWPGLRGLAALNRAEAVVWTGGLDLQDDSSLLKLLHTWLTFASYRLLGKKIYAVMQGAGPLNSRPGRLMAQGIVRLTEKFLARDSGTRNLLESIGVGRRVRLAHDGIFLAGLDQLQAAPSEEAEIDRLAPREYGRPTIGVNVRMWFHFRGGILPYSWAKEKYARRSSAEMERLIGATVSLVRSLRRKHDARIVLVSMYEPDAHPWEDDLPHLERVKAATADDDQVVVLRAPLGIGGFGELLRRFDLMIGSRLHSTLAALRFGVPAINLAYTNKCRDIFTDLGLANRFVDLTSFIADPEIVAGMASEVLSDLKEKAKIRNLVRARIEENERLLESLFIRANEIGTRRAA